MIKLIAKIFYGIDLTEQPKDLLIADNILKEKAFYEAIEHNRCCPKYGKNVTVISEYIYN